MTQLSTKIQLYAKEHGQDTIDFFSDVRLQDDGAGPYIKEWNLADIAQPTDADLAAYDQAAEKEALDNVVRAKRHGAYASIRSQLDMLYWDKKNGTNVWEQHVDTVKAKFPKP